MWGMRCDVTHSTDRNRSGLENTKDRRCVLLRQRREQKRKGRMEWSNV